MQKHEQSRKKSLQTLRGGANHMDFLPLKTKESISRGAPSKLYTITKFKISTKEHDEKQKTNTPNK